MGRHTWLVSGSSQQQAASHLQLTWSRAPLGLAFVNANCRDSDWKTFFSPPLPFPSACVRPHRFFGGVFFTAFDTLTYMIPRSRKICSVCLYHLSKLASSFSYLFITLPWLFFQCVCLHVFGCHPFDQSRREKK